MKKGFLVLLMLLSSGLFMEVSAHNDGYARDFCGWFVYPRYGAWAEVHRGHIIANGGSFDLSGRYIRTTTYAWNKVAQDAHSGCSRPLSAYKEYWEYMNLDGGTGMNWFGSNAGWKVDFTPGFPKGYQTAHWSNHSLLKPGIGEEMVLDDEKWAAMDKAGNTYGKIIADMELDKKTQTLKINDLSGQLSIYPGSNFYSTYKILVVKERMDGTEEDSKRFDQNTNNLVFENVVASGELNVTKSGLSVGGFLQQIVKTERSLIEEDTSYGFRLQNLSGTINLPNINLAANETLTLIVYSDGGFDFTPAFFQYDPAATMQHKMKYVPEDKLSVYPNPSDGQINITVNSATVEKASIQLYDLSGRMVKQVFEGTLNKGNNLFNAVDVKELKSSMYLLKVSKKGSSLYSKITIK